MLQDHVHNLTLQLLSQAHWKSRVENVKVVRCQTSQMWMFLFKLVETSDYFKIRSEANSFST